MLPTRNAAVALLVMLLSTSACEFFTTKPFAPDVDQMSYVNVPDVLAKYAPELPPTMYARANALGVSLSTGSVIGDAVQGLRLSAAPLSPLAVDLASVTPAEWVSQLGTGLTQIDDDALPQALPFAFSFYGQSYSSVFVSPNGHLSFGSAISFKRSWNIPDGSNMLAAPAYADWMPASRFGFASLQNSRVFVNTVGEVGDRRFVVTWNDIRPCCSLSYPGSSFQLQLVERTGEMVFAYREMQMIVSNSSAGVAAAASHVLTASGASVLALQGCAITYTPNAGSYRAANSCAPEPVNLPPAVQVGGPYAGTEGSEISVGGSATDENGDALTYSWDLGDGTTKLGDVVAHSYIDNGNYPATLAVSDGELVTIASTRVDIANEVPSIGSLAGTSLYIGEPFHVSTTLADPGAQDAPWHWSITWGDGESAEGDATSLGPLELSHNYTEIGSYQVSLSVRDKDGDVTSASTEVVVLKDEIKIDIKPWQTPNRIYLKGRWDRVIPVAILSNERLDASTIDVASVKLGQVGVSRYRRGGDDDDDDDDDNEDPVTYTYISTLMDIDRDGDQDLVVVFDRKALVKAGDLTRATTSLTLTGSAGDRHIAGSEPIQVVK